jgi:hypothetical protein
MALDPMIARGVQPVDISNTLAQVAALRQRDQGLQQSAQQNAFTQQKYQDEQDQDDEEDLMFADLTTKAQQAYDQGGEEAATPFLLQASRIDPHSAGLLAQAMRRRTEEQRPKPPEYRAVGDALLEMPTTAGADPRVAYRAPAKPQSASDAPKPQLVDVPMPDGTVQKQWLAPGQSSGQPVGAPTSGQPLSPKDTNTARTKLTQVKVARQQLNVAKQKFAAIKDSLSAGPGGKYLPTPAGKAFDAAIDTMRSSITALTKVPGLGSMSDYETRLDQAKFPDRGQYEDVAEQQLQAIEDLLNTVDGGYSEMLGSKSQSQAPQGGKATPKPGDNVRGYIFIGGNPADKSRWVKAR